MQVKLTIKHHRFSWQCVVQAIIITIFCCKAFASNEDHLLDKPITLNLKEVSLEAVLKELESQTAVKFIYSIDQLNIKQTVSIRVDKEPLRKVLNDLLSPLNIRYKVHAKESSITLKREGKVSDKSQSEKEENNNNELEAIKLSVSGIVTDATTTLPLPGVNVIIKGTSAGTTTDADGAYTIEVSDSELLVFSFIGYQTSEVRVSSQSIINVALREDIKSLDEVVVNAGYYKTTKELQTGNIVKVESKELQKQPVSNPIAALQAKVPGLEVIQQNGVPGGNFKIRIRGTNSIASGNDPLYIIDGVPFTSNSQSFAETSGNILGSPSPVAAQGSSPLNTINPADIESIEILKDADATAIYGSRGANGVILITTKRGKTGTTKIDAGFYSGVAKVSNNMALMNTQQYIKMRKTAFANDKVTPTAANAPDLLVWDTTRYTDWQKKLIGGSANITDATMSISGGEKNTQFLIGGGFHKETTVFPGSNSDQRISLHSNITNTSPNQKLKTSLSLNISKNISDLLSEDLTNRALTLSPNAPALRDANGNLSWANWTPAIENPLAFLKRKYEASSNNLVSSLNIGYSILSNLEVRVNMGYTSMMGEAVTTIPISSLSPSASLQVNRSIFSKSNFQNWIVEPQLNWKPKLGEGYFDILAGTTFLDQKSQGVAQFANGFMSEALMKNIGAAASITAATNYYSQYRYQAFFGRLNYILKDRYIINVTGRRDGSSRFGPGKQFAIFSAVGAAWIFSKENFVSNLIRFMSLGKLRASYGTTGNDQIGDYQFLDTYTSSGLYQNKVGLSPARLNNPNFAWETNRKFESAIDLGFYKDRLLLNMCYYQNTSSNQLVGFPLAPTTGFPSIQGNFPATVRNKGIEINLNTVNIVQSKNGFGWSTSFNITIPKNTLVEFPNIKSFPAYTNSYVVGKPLEIKKLYTYTGIDPATGQYQFKDVDNDLAITQKDKQAIKFMGRKLYGGLQNSIQYKGLTLDFSFQFVKQNGNAYIRLFTSPPGTLSNQPAAVINAWQSGNSEVQPFTTTSSASYNQLLDSNKAIVDASFVRLKNLSLSYLIPENWISKLHIANATTFIQCQNLVTLTSYKGLNPETPGSSNLPPLRTITGGVRLTF